MNYLDKHSRVANVVDQVGWVAAYGLLQVAAYRQSVPFGLYLAKSLLTSPQDAVIEQGSFACNR